MKGNALLLAIRIRGFNDGTTPQGQKILSDLGLRQINNAVFLSADVDTLKKLKMVEDHVTYGYPTKKIVTELVRKRGFLRRNEKKEPITNNVLIEELFTEHNERDEQQCICIEDIIDGINNCHKAEMTQLFKEVQNILWPMQIGSLRETIEGGNIKHDATGREIRKKNTKFEKGGYIGF